MYVKYSHSVSEALAHLHRFGRPRWSSRLGVFVLVLQDYFTGGMMESNYKPQVGTWLLAPVQIKILGSVKLTH